MIWWIIFIECVVCFVWGCAIAHRKNWYDDNTLVLAWLSGAIGLAVFFVVLATSCSAISWRMYLIQIDRDFVVLAEREAHLVKTVKDSVSQYPLEKDFLGELNPALLLKLPEIKSNRLLQTQIEALLEIQDCIYAKRLEQNKILVKLETIRMYRWIHPAVAFPPPMEAIKPAKGGQ